MIQRPLKRTTDKENSTPRSSTASLKAKKFGGTSAARATRSSLSGAKPKPKPLQSHAHVAGAGYAASAQHNQATTAAASSSKPRLVSTNTAAAKKLSLSGNRRVSGNNGASRADGARLSTSSTGSNSSSSVGAVGGTTPHRSLSTGTTAPRSYAPASVTQRLPRSRKRLKKTRSAQLSSLIFCVYNVFQLF